MPSSLPRPAIALLLVCAAVWVSACAGTHKHGCQRIRDDHDAFLARETPATVPHLALSVPFEVIDRLVAAEVAKLPPLRLELPDIAGFSVGSLVLRVEQVHARPAPPGRLGFLIQLGLSSGRQRVMGVDIQAVVTPRIDPRAREVVVALEGRDLHGVSPRLDQSGARGLAELVWSELPAAARMLTSKRQIEQLAREMAQDLVGQAFAQVERELLDELGELTRIELELPELPVSRVELATDAGHLGVHVYTSLPVSRGLTDANRRAPGIHTDLVQVRIAGPTAAELGNHAMRSGEIPPRWNLAGEPDEDGPLHAGLAWNDREDKPLALHLWRLDEDCAHVRLGATPRVSLDGDRLVLSTDDARVEAVQGALKVRAGIWFSGLGRRSFAFVEETAASVDFEIAGEPLKARVEVARLTGDELVLGLRLDPAPPRPRGRR